ncbi:hypothetical protein ACF0H5_011261 [Mactra antiquata]
MYLPNASILKSKFILSDVNDQVTAPLTVSSPIQKLEKFKKEHTCIIDSCNCANIFMYYSLCYTPEECEEIEQLTRGQSDNNNWHIMRKGLLTASKFHLVCCSTDFTKTAQALLKSDIMKDFLPPAIHLEECMKQRPEICF